MNEKGAKSSPIQAAVERKLKAWLSQGATQPTRLEIAVLDRALKYLAIVAKLDEGEFGSELDTLDESGNGKAGTDESDNH